MPHPLVPALFLAAAAGAAYLLFDDKTPTKLTPKKPPRPGEVPTPEVPPVPTPEGDLHSFTLGDFSPGEELEIHVKPTDMIRFDFSYPAATGDWTVNTEAVEGDPVLEVGYEDVRPEHRPGVATIWRFITDVIAHPGTGAVKLNFERRLQSGASESRTAYVYVA